MSNIRIWKGTSTTLSESWQLKLHPEIDEDETLVERMNYKKQPTLIDINSGNDMAPVMIKLSGPSGIFATQNGEGSPVQLNDYLYTLRKSKTQVTIFNQDTGEYWRGKIIKLHPLLKNRQNLWEFNLAKELYFTLSCTEHGTFSDYDTYSSTSEVTR